jgi:hypothetical protein
LNHFHVDETVPKKDAADFALVAVDVHDLDANNPAENDVPERLPGLVAERLLSFRRIDAGEADPVLDPGIVKDRQRITVRDRYDFSGNRVVRLGSGNTCRDDRDQEHNFRHSPHFESSIPASSRLNKSVYEPTFVRPQVRLHRVPLQSAVGFAHAAMLPGFVEVCSRLRDNGFGCAVLDRPLDETVEEFDVGQYAFFGVPKALELWFDGRHIMHWDIKPTKVLVAAYDASPVPKVIEDERRAIPECLLRPGDPRAAFIRLN